MDEKTSLAIEPELFRSRYVTETKVIATWDSQNRRFIDKPYELPMKDANGNPARVFENERGELLCVDNVSWSRCGEHDVYIGFEKEIVSH